MFRFSQFLKLFSFLALLIGVASFSYEAQAQSSRVYFAGYFGLMSHEKMDFDESSSGRSGNFDFENTFSFAGALGLRLDRQLRIEGEYSFRSASIDKVNTSGNSYKSGDELNTSLFMLNGYYDLDMEWQNLMPFISAGVGFAWHSMDINDASNLLSDADDSSFGLAWQLGGGLKYRVSDDLAWTGSYRFIGTTELAIDNYDIGFGSHEFRIGLEYDLPVAKTR